MAHNIRMAKLITGELVIGKFDAEKKMLNDIALLQIVPTQQGIQMMLLPFGYPFEQDFCGSVSASHFVYEYKKTPEDLETKYLEACTNLTLSTSGLNLSNQKAPGKISTIIK